MIHFLYLVTFGLIVAVAFGVFTEGTQKDKIFSGLKVFAQFIGISLAMAWIFYFLPW
ncbi:MAG: hypothetical protein HKN33_07210 [Pyrinomonadaceae bacterium]|nr:hypothetical protein [Pyrinomonadaceae bacterium]